MTAQDKILYVANKLGLTSLKNMQASTGAVYDVDTEASGQIFSNATRHVNPGVANIADNQFEVNEALLIETVGFYGRIADSQGTSAGQINNLQRTYGSNFVIVYDIIIGNKRVQKQTPVFGSGSPYCFATNAIGLSTFEEDPNDLTYFPRHQVYSEAVGILIPPQVQFYVEYRLFNVVTGAQIPISNDAQIGCYLYGTKVLLNFNTSI
jgi:hypothetical protein